MKTKDKIKVSFNITVSRTYNIDEIADFVENNCLVSDDTETTLKQMIIIDTIDSINNGRGTFKIIG